MDKAKVVAALAQAWAVVKANPKVIGVLVLVAALIGACAAKAQGRVWDVVQAECDKDGAVTAMAIAVAEPTIVAIRWDNKAVCGKGV